MDGVEAGRPLPWAPTMEFYDSVPTPDLSLTPSAGKKKLICTGLVAKLSALAETQMADCRPAHDSAQAAYQTVVGHAPHGPRGKNLHAVC